MIKQNHSNVTAVVTMLVVLLGCGIASVEAKEKSHNKGHGTHKVEHHHQVKHEKQRNEVKGKKHNLSKRTKHHTSTSSKKGLTTTGIASWYGPGFHGRKTASGERFNMYALTAAHKTLPLHSMVKVTNTKNHKSIVVKINDRGPYARGRSLDLSLASARALGVRGTAKVEMVVL